MLGRVYLRTSSTKQQKDLYKLEVRESWTSNTCVRLGKTLTKLINKARLNTAFGFILLLSLHTGRARQW